MTLKYNTVLIDSNHVLWLLCALFVVFMYEKDRKVGICTLHMTMSG